MRLRIGAIGHPNAEQQSQRVGKYAANPLLGKGYRTHPSKKGSEKGFKNFLDQKRFLKPSLPECRLFSGCLRPRLLAVAIVLGLNDVLSVLEGFRCLTMYRRFASRHRRGEVSALEQSSDGLGVFATALGFAAVDGFHAPGMSQREGDAVVAAGVGEPVPAVHALAINNESIAEGCDGFAEGLGIGG